MAERAGSLNADCRFATIDRPALDDALRLEGGDFFQAVNARPYLFSDVALFISAAQLEQMREVVAAVERVVELDGWMNVSPRLNPPPMQIPSPQSSPARGRGGEREKLSSISAGEEANEKGNIQSLGVFFGYDFHLNADGTHLIEINTNAGGAFLNAMLLRSQSQLELPGEAVAQENLSQVFLDMFRNEWKLERGDAPLQTIVIVDEQPLQQYLYPEFVLAQRLFERAGMAVLIADPTELEARGDGLYCGGRRIDLIYNRLTDFSLQQHPVLLSAYQNSQVVLTPHPHAYARYADKRNLARLGDAAGLRAISADEDSIAVLQRGIPQTVIVEGDAEKWWSERKQWFFKPATGYAGKAAYRGSKITRHVFEEIMQGDYVAQKFAAPGERMVCVDGGEAVPLKSDVRCYVYDGKVQLVAARLYQGQTTNFRTPGGGFAPVRLV